MACLRDGLRGQLAGENCALHAGQVPLLREIACIDNTLKALGNRALEPENSLLARYRCFMNSPAVTA